MILPDHLTIHALTPTDLDAALLLNKWGSGANPDTALPFTQVARVAKDVVKVMGSLSKQGKPSDSTLRLIEQRHGKEQWETTDSILQELTSMLEHLNDVIGKENLMDTTCLQPMDQDDDDDQVEELFEDNAEEEEEEEEGEEPEEEREEEPPAPREQAVPSPIQSPVKVVKTRAPVVNRSRASPKKPQRRVSKATPPRPQRQAPRPPPLLVQYMQHQPYLDKKPSNRTEIRLPSQHIWQFLDWLGDQCKELEK